MSKDQEVPRIGVLWRGDRQAEASLPRADRGLGPLYDAFAGLPVVLEPVPYHDDAVDEVRKQLLTLDGLLVWVNPIQDGALARTQAARSHGASRVSRVRSE